MVVSFLYRIWMKNYTSSNQNENKVMEGGGGKRIHFHFLCLVSGSRVLAAANQWTRDTKQKEIEFFYLTFHLLFYFHFVLKKLWSRRIFFSYTSKRSAWTSFFLFITFCFFCWLSIFLFFIPLFLSSFLLVSYG